MELPILILPFAFIVVTAVLYISWLIKTERKEAAEAKKTKFPF